MGWPFYSTLRTAALNFPGWRTRRKLVVIESDDWGSIRMPGRAVYDQLRAEGVNLDWLSYQRYDSLATADDLQALFKTLESVRDKNGRPAVLTANTIVANPDFEKIAASDFEQYFFEPFTVTLQRSPDHRDAFTAWQDGMKRGVFRPQFHGREHLHTGRWMRALRERVPVVRRAFKLGMFDLITRPEDIPYSFMDALRGNDASNEAELPEILTEGLDLFENIFGYRAKTFIAPCHVWPSSVEPALLSAGILAMQGNPFQKQPVYGSRGKLYRSLFHYTGQTNPQGMRYLVRNAFFEPSQQPSRAWEQDVLQRAATLFRLGKPLIIGSHRVNFCGYLDPGNREHGLRRLGALLTELVGRWPDSEFIASDELAELIGKD